MCEADRTRRQVFIGVESLDDFILPEKIPTGGKS